MINLLKNYLNYMKMIYNVILKFYKNFNLKINIHIYFMG